MIIFLLRSLHLTVHFKLCVNTGANVIAYMYIWSEPPNNGSCPESVVLSLVTVQADARCALTSTDSTVIGGSRSLWMLTVLPLCSSVFDYL